LKRYDTTFLFISLGLVEKRYYIDAGVNPSGKAFLEMSFLTLGTSFREDEKSSSQSVKFL